MRGIGPGESEGREGQAASLRSREQRLRQSMEAVLKRYLSTAQLQSLRDLSGGFNKLPFQFDRESGRFEIADSWMARLIEWEDAGTNSSNADSSADSSVEPGDEPLPGGGPTDSDPDFPYGWDIPPSRPEDVSFPAESEGLESERESDYDWDEFAQEAPDTHAASSPTSPISESRPLTAADRASLAALEAGLQESAMDSAVDLLCRACDVLTAHQDELDLELLERQPEGGRFTFEFDFAQPDAHHKARIMDDETGEIFEQLLRQTADWSVHSEPLPGGRIVRVAVTYRSEAEFARVRDHLNWLLDLAARQRQRRPFEGTRLS